MKYASDNFNKQLAIARKRHPGCFWSRILGRSVTTISDSTSFADCAKSHFKDQRQIFRQKREPLPQTIGPLPRQPTGDWVANSRQPKPDGHPRTGYLRPARSGETAFQHGQKAIQTRENASQIKKPAHVLSVLCCGPFLASLNFPDPQNRNTRENGQLKKVKAASTVNSSNFISGLREIPTRRIFLDGDIAV